MCELRSFFEWLEQEARNADHGVLCADRAMEQATKEYEASRWWQADRKRRWRRAMRTAATVVIRQATRRKILRWVLKHLREDAGNAI